jgi:hypothetical protein
MGIADMKSLKLPLEVVDDGCNPVGDYGVGYYLCRIVDQQNVQIAYTQSSLDNPKGAKAKAEMLVGAFNAAQTGLLINRNENGDDILITRPLLVGEPEEKWISYDVYKKLKKQIL